MRVITVHRVSIQFDVPAPFTGNPETLASLAIDSANELLKQQYPLGMQIITHPDEIEVVDEGEET